MKGFSSLSVPNMHYPVNSIANSSSQQFFDLKPIKGPRAPHPVKPSPSFSTANINSPFTCSTSNNSLICLPASSFPAGNNKKIQRPYNTHQQLRADKLSTNSSFSGQPHNTNTFGQQPTFRRYFFQELFQQQQQCTFRNFFDSLKQTAFMACCFCCCPIFRCVLWFCAFELICTFICWFGELNNLFKLHTNIELRNIIILLIISGWLITLLVSTVSICLAKYKDEAQWILPRLVQQTGLLILGFLFALLLVFYFSGASQTINNIIISIYEPVTQNDPSAPPPQPPVNPYYKGSFT
uniref:MARVEL domain-containing protein n=1 Tax=Meloidogyne hapla TaxID=6305 RepID=A0A1I8BCW5_MELHA